MSTEQVVFLHGLGAGPDSWEAQIATLPKGFSGTAPRISGLSDNGGAEFSFSGAAAEIVRGLDRRGIERAHVCGLSIGAMLALRTAVDHPDRVASLVLSGGQVNPPQVVLHLQSVLTRVLPARVIAPNGMSRRRALAALEEVSRVDLRAQLPGVEVPALVLCGSWDLVNLPAARATAAGLPNARLRIVESGGHELNVHKPADFAAELATFYRDEVSSP
ncbi:alpha/beta fold hydrolase [Nocardiopsis kunsanensis]|uniref:Hydrolase n=1 Tax=Nocardiopsis kunsanensis TaxID=141693 RepID=A0A918XJ57_9ACTN|nr:alpha/beta hydrolase [Nocardiopsis kunsanensis]GHD34199.1 hydrolase [Nocardiopsis kunsanensis]